MVPWHISPVMVGETKKSFCHANICADSGFVIEEEDPSQLSGYRLLAYIKQSLHEYCQDEFDPRPYDSGYELHRLATMSMVQALDIFSALDFMQGLGRLLTRFRVLWRNVTTKDDPWLNHMYVDLDFTLEYNGLKELLSGSDVEIVAETFYNVDNLDVKVARLDELSRRLQKNEVEEDFIAPRFSGGVQARSRSMGQGGKNKWQKKLTVKAVHCEDGQRATLAAVFPFKQPWQVPRNQRGYY